MKYVFTSIVVLDRLFLSFPRRCFSRKVNVKIAVVLRILLFLKVGTEQILPQLEIKCKETEAKGLILQTLQDLIRQHGNELGECGESEII